MRVKTALFVLLALVAAAGASAWFFWQRTLVTDAPDTAGKAAPADDPRLTYPTRYRNVRPEVKYVGDEACAACHVSESSSYHHHPMAHSMSLVSQAVPVERYDAAAGNPFAKAGFDFAIERRDEQVFHKVSRRDVGGKEALSLARAARYAVGSGSHGRAYLTELDQHIFQTPINWFTQGRRWDLAPNVGDTQRSHFFRGVDALCIYCHANQAEPVADSLNRYRAPLPARLAIGCERCHGPGQLHVQRHNQAEAAEGPDDTIVNPASLEPALRESICQQCHLQGEFRVLHRGRQLYDFRPGLPLHLFWSVFLRTSRNDQEREAVSHVEQLFASKCFRASEGKLGCISCHDPHDYPAPEKKAAVYRQACLKCHRETACPVPMPERQAQKQNDCAACHMPRLRTTDVAHTATSDHRIPRRPGQAFQSVGMPRQVFSEAIPLVNFHEGLVDPADRGARRDFAVGVIDLVEPMPPGPPRREAAQVALPFLREAVEKAPDDLPALHAQGFALWVLGFPNEAAAGFDAVLDKAPEREVTLSYAAQLAAGLGRKEAARAFWERAIAVNPYAPSYRIQLGLLFVQDKDWPRALEQARAAGRINPLSADVHMLLIDCYLSTGRKKEAREEFDKLMALEPPNAEQLRTRFGEMMK